MVNFYDGNNDLQLMICDCPFFFLEVPVTKDIESEHNSQPTDVHVSTQGELIFLYKRDHIRQ